MIGIFEKSRLIEMKKMLMKTVNFFWLIFLLLSSSVNGQEKIPELYIRTGHSFFVNSFAFSSDGILFASGSEDGIKLWDVESGQELRTFTSTDQKEFVKAIVFSLDDKTIISSNLTGIIKIWDVISGKILKTLTGHKTEVNSILLSSDGKRLFSLAEGGEIIIWDIESGRQLRTIKQQFEFNGGYAIALSPDNKTLAVGTNASITFFNVTTGKLMKRISNAEKWFGRTNGDAMRAAAPGIITLAFLPDGKTIISGRGDKTFAIWDIETGETKRLCTGSAEV